MADRARKKERQRLKRKEKQRAHRKAASISTFARIAKSGGEVRCWMNPSYRTYRQASIFALREMPNGSHVLAAFLVDLGVIGLKDAWGRLDITPAEFQDEILARTDEEIGMKQVDPDEARRLVAASIRFSHDNGFRLPHRYERWVAVLGGVGDWHNADVSEFAMEFAGTLKELRQRLIGEPIERFLDRDDIQFIIRDGDESLTLSDEQVESEEQEDELVQKGVDAVRRWCFAQNRQPHRMLKDAWGLLLSAHLEAAIESDDESDLGPDGDATLRAQAILAGMLALENPERQELLLAALAQAAEFTESLSSPEEMMELMHIDE